MQIITVSFDRAKLKAHDYKDDLSAKNFYRFGYHEKVCRELQRRLTQDGKFSSTIHDELIQNSFKLILKEQCSKQIFDAVQEDLMQKNKLKLFAQGVCWKRGKVPIDIFFYFSMDGYRSAVTFGQVSQNGI